MKPGWELQGLEVPGGGFDFKSSMRGASPGQGDAESQCAGYHPHSCMAEGQHGGRRES